MPLSMNIGSGAGCLPLQLEGKDLPISTNRGLLPLSGVFPGSLKHPELERAQVQPIQVRSIPHWPHLGWHCHLCKYQQKLGQNYHKLDLMETFFQRQEMGVKFSSSLKDTGWNGRSRAQLQHFPGQWGLLSTASFKPVCSYAPWPPAAGIYIFIDLLYQAFDSISHHYNLPLSLPDTFPTWSDKKKSFKEKKTEINPKIGLWKIRVSCHSTQIHCISLRSAWLNLEFMQKKKLKNSVY